MQFSANRSWKFYRGEPPRGKADESNPHAKGMRPIEPNYDDGDWDTVHLPHTVREEALVCSGGYNYRGECWYRKLFRIRKSWENKDLFLEFEGAMQRADVWVDGHPALCHKGGFLPFGVDLTGLAAGEHVIILRLDNSDMPDVPPGKPQEDLDFCYFGGLYREATLYVNEKLRFTRAVHEGRPAAGGLYIRFPHVDRERAEVRVTASCINRTTKRAKISVVLLFDGKEVCRGEEKYLLPGAERDETLCFTAEHPELWSPASPALHTLTARLYAGKKLVDEHTERVGVRSAEFRTDGFYLNGEKLFLSGANRHQEYPYVGFAVPDSAMRRDLRIMKSFGANVVRTAHYPMNRAFFDACDELGIFVITPTPGWQIYPNSVEFDEASFLNTRRMIRYHRNHACVLLWEVILNETDYTREFAENQLAAAREEFGDFPMPCSCDWYAPGAEDFDVNYSHSESVKPRFIREYNDHYLEQYGPRKTMYRTRRGEHTDFYPGGEEANLYNAELRFTTYRNFVTASPGLSGCAVWACFDNNRGYFSNEGAWGLLDSLRLPKFSYELYVSQRPVGEVGGKCFIANDRTENSPCDVKVFTNAERVRLLLNGREISVREAERVNEIVHPPIVFENVPFERGTLRAEAFVGEELVAVCERKSPAAPAKLLLKPLWMGENVWRADGSDLLLVHVFVTDEEGTAVPSAEPPITFTVTGDAEIVGNGMEWVHSNPVCAEAGATGVLLRAGTHAGEVVLRARSEGLKEAEIVLRMQEDGREQMPAAAYRARRRTSFPVDARTNAERHIQKQHTELEKLDLARGKKCFASSCAEGSRAENVNTGTVGEPWTANLFASLPQWWGFDLGEKHMLDGLVILWEDDAAWYDFDVEISLDGKVWKKVYSGSASGQNCRPDRFDSPVEARCVRIVVTHTSSGVPASLLRVEAFGN